MGISLPSKSIEDSTALLTTLRQNQATQETFCIRMHSIRAKVRVYDIPPCWHCNKNQELQILQLERRCSLQALPRRWSQQGKNIATSASQRLCQSHSLKRQKHPSNHLHLMSIDPLAVEKTAFLANPTLFVKGVLTAKMGAKWKQISPRWLELGSDPRTPHDRSPGRRCHPGSQPHLRQPGTGDESEGKDTT